METLGEAFSAGWEAEMRCQKPSRTGTAKGKPCRFSMRLHMETLVATRGHKFPAGKLQSRLICPRCGHREVLVVFHGGNKLAVRHHG